MTRGTGRAGRGAAFFLAGVGLLALGLWIEAMREAGAAWTEPLQALPADVFAYAGIAFGGLMILRAALRRLLGGPGAKTGPDAVASPVYRMPRSQEAPAADWQKRLAQKSRSGTVGYNAPVPGGAEALQGRAGPGPSRRRFGAFRMGAIACVLAALGVGVAMIVQDMPEETVPKLLARIGVTTDGPGTDA